MGLELGRFADDIELPKKRAVVESSNDSKRRNKNINEATINKKPVKKLKSNKENISENNASKSNEDSDSKKVNTINENSQKLKKNEKSTNISLNEISNDSDISRKEIIGTKLTGKKAKPLKKTILDNKDSNIENKEKDVILKDFKKDTLSDVDSKNNIDIDNKIQSKKNTTTKNKTTLTEPSDAGKIYNNEDNSLIVNESIENNIKNEPIKPPAPLPLEKPKKPVENIYRSYLDEQKMIPFYEHTAQKGPGLSYHFWNVGSLRTQLNTNLLNKLLEQESPAILGIAETKISPLAQLEFGKKLVAINDNYKKVYLNSSFSRRGYAGTAALIRSDVNIIKVIFGFNFCSTDGKPAKSPVGDVKISQIGDGIYAKESEELRDNVPVWRNSHHALTWDSEGRVVTLELEKEYVIMIYVPNIGINLERHAWRSEQFDVAVRNWIAELERTKPVVLLGDMNAARFDRDIYNIHQSHIYSMPGTTVNERRSLEKYFSDSKMIDAFDYKHPNTTGSFTYWSVKAKNREGNKGIRFDYSLVSSSAKDRINDAYILYKYAEAGDHCPVGILMNQN